MSNDDLQTLDKELTALNHRLQVTVERQRATFRNLQSILDSTEVPILVLDTDLNIRFFTPAGKALSTVVASDVGRPLADLSRRFEDDDFLPDAWRCWRLTRRSGAGKSGRGQLVHSRDACLLLPQAARQSTSPTRSPMAKS
ncbi:MAG: PAS domain-containing protein [Hyphomicrobiaceae bacterium]